MKVRLLIFSILLNLCAPDAAGLSPVNIADTMDLLLNGQSAGTLRSYLSITKDAAELRSELVTEMVDQNGNTLAANTISERRRFSSEGKLVEAFQEITSPAGKNLWSLSRDQGGWVLVVNAGGVENRRKIDEVHESISSTSEIYKGISNSSIKPGDMWVDSTFELVSGQHFLTKTVCREVPSEQNNNRWIFTNWCSLYDREERWELDKNGKTVLREAYPFVTRIKGGSEVKYRNADLFEALSIKKEKIRSNEKIALHADSMPLDTSAMSLYTRDGRYLILKETPGTCVNKEVKPGQFPDSLKRFTMPTPTMQIANKSIKSLSSSLKEKSNSSCELVKTINDYVFRKLTKKNTATFSSALETLNAGFGDCGEHAVLLAALLRAAGVPARVVLGLVYVESRKGYYYHAWVMAHTGEWVFADPAFGVFPAPGERIPLIIDDTGEGAVQLARILGRLKVEHLSR